MSHAIDFKAKRCGAMASVGLIGVVVLLMLAERLVAGQQGDLPSPPSDGERIAMEFGEDVVGQLEDGTNKAAPAGGAHSRGPAFDVNKNNFPIEGETYFVKISNQGHRASAVDKRTLKVVRLDMPPKVTVTSAIVGDFDTAIFMRGTGIRRLFVYNGRLRKWVTFELPSCERPIDARVTVGSNVTSFQLKDRIIGYSSIKDRWGMLVEKVAAPAAVGDDSITVPTPTKKCEFNAQSGAWSVVAAQETQTH